MAKIVFVPVCSKCEKIIFQTVDYSQGPLVLPEAEPFIVKDRGIISPDKCPRCGAYFDCIIMPQSLPFDMDDMDMRW